MKKIIKITGMHCKSCKSLIEAELSDIEGIDNVTVSIEKGIAEIVMKNNCIEIVLKSIENLGFSAQVKE
ncbi:heavy-metal-associated domain-containing protein [Candidatus Micrarchaeota archaeon]|nr:heavy-metal-associated domain-containing protein [Candidatus Micrarchaeota archaeon]